MEGILVARRKPVEHHIKFVPRETMEPPYLVRTHLDKQVISHVEVLSGSLTMA
jgi:hypothetical protein